MSYTERALVRAQVPFPVGSATGTVNAATVALYSYATDDAAATVETAGYFNNARGRLTKGSIIIATMTISGTPVAKIYVATAVPTTGNVVIALAATAAG